ncbi:MAG TPA: isoprenylcysteine carboxylmethyltransferase family protein [Paludibacteraceae bacterium]|nr:isoprenylcysteine carboxylmethyltransferase family protein [Paludibacteraceae bacterium]
MALQEEMEKQGNFLFKYRGYLPLIIVAIGLAVFIEPYLNVIDIFALQYSTIQFIGLFISLIGLFIRAYAVGHTPANTSGRNTKEQLADELNTTGIYSTVRHPLYLGNFFMWLGAAILINNGWFVVAFILLYWIYYERIMFAEEQFLRRKFGSAYTDWADKTPAFIPNFGKYIPSKYPFSWKKVLKKEKNGLLAVFVLLFVFHNINYSFQTGHISIDLNWIAWGTFAAGILYLVLKFLKKKTSILNETGR